MLVDIAVVDRVSPSKKRFELNYIFWNKSFNCRIILIGYGDGFNPMISLTGIYPSSNWLEREIWDMYGIRFLFHPDLRRILTDYGFKGHPLRKNFPLIGYVELIYNDRKQSLQTVPVEMAQAFRFYEFLNPWVRHKNYDNFK